MSLILAIDLGKYNSVFCGLDPATGEAEFRTAKTTPATLRKELTRRPVGRVVIEACTPAARRNGEVSGTQWRAGRREPPDSPRPS